MCTCCLLDASFHNIEALNANVIYLEEKYNLRKEILMRKNNKRWRQRGTVCTYVRLSRVFGKMWLVRYGKLSLADVTNWRDKSITTNCEITAELLDRSWGNPPRDGTKRAQISFTLGRLVVYYGICFKFCSHPCEGAVCWRASSDVLTLIAVNYHAY